MEGAQHCVVNHTPLTPISYLEHSALVYGDRPAVAGAGTQPQTWREMWAHCFRLAAALADLVERGDVVAVFARNIPAMCELHFAVPMADAVICALNSSFDAAMVSDLLCHSEAKVIFVDATLLGVTREALKLMLADNKKALDVVLIKELLDHGAMF